jgi:hypothetical protein
MESRGGETNLEGEGRGRFGEREKGRENLVVSGLLSVLSHGGHARQHQGARARGLSVRRKSVLLGHFTHIFREGNAGGQKSTERIDPAKVLLLLLRAPQNGTTMLLPTRRDLPGSARPSSQLPGIGLRQSELLSRCMPRSVFPLSYAARVLCLTHPMHPGRRARAPRPAARCSDLLPGCISS